MNQCHVLFYINDYSTFKHSLKYNVEKRQSIFKKNILNDMHFNVIKKSLGLDNSSGPIF